MGSFLPQHTKGSIFTIFNFFIDGDLGAYADAKKAYMKQKHRMIWERRNGKLSEQT